MLVVASPAFAIRKRPEVVFTLNDLCRLRQPDDGAGRPVAGSGRGPPELADCRGTGSGKTTLTNAILAERAFAADRVVLVEDSAELQCAALDKVEILTKRTEPQETRTDPVRDTLGLRPDRIVIG
jgi:Flp pilus assembly CpaF family ATPase